MKWARTAEGGSNGKIFVLLDILFTVLPLIAYSNLFALLLIKHRQAVKLWWVGRLGDGACVLPLKWTDDGQGGGGGQEDGGGEGGRKEVRRTKQMKQRVAECDKSGSDGKIFLCCLFKFLCRN